MERSTLSKVRLTLTENKQLKFVLISLVILSQVVQQFSYLLVSSFLLIISFSVFTFIQFYELKAHRFFQKCIISYLILNIVAIIYGINSTETENFLFIINFMKLAINQIVLAVLLTLHKSKSYKQRSKKEPFILSFIFVCAFSFIILSVQYFNLSTQLIVLVRMVQFAIIAYYGLFRKNLNVFVTLFVLSTFLGDFIAGARVAGLLSTYSYFAQNIFLFAGMYFFCIGINDILTKKTQHKSFK